MTYPSENFYPAFDAGASSRGGVFTQWIARARGAVGNAVAEFAYWRGVHETTRQLAQLDDTILKDIGLQRYQIASAARRIALAKRAGRRRPPQPTR